MILLLAKQIQKEALVRGSSMSWVDFLKSEDAANRVADKVWKHLTRAGNKGRKREHIVVVEKSPYHTGTWSVRVMLPGVILSSLVSGGGELNAMEQDEAVKALQASYGPADLVTRWTS